MSRIINYDISDHCKPWQAPDLDSSKNTNYDYKLSDIDVATHHQQQEQIRQQSYEKSYAKGYMEGLEKGQNEINDQLVHLQSLLTALSMPLPEVDNQVVDELASLSMAVAKQMIRRELKMSPDEVVAVVREALNLLPATATSITVELHPEDAKLINQALVPTGTDSSWTIKEDPLLTRGGCRVLTDASRIDASLESRMNAVIAEVMGGERKVDDQS